VKKEAGASTKKTYFKNYNHPPSSKGGKHVSHMGVSCRRDTAFPEDVSVGRIESS
jgi:hypothetical protein